MPCSSGLNVDSSLCVERLVCAIYVPFHKLSCCYNAIHSAGSGACVMLQHVNCDCV